MKLKTSIALFYVVLFISMAGVMLGSCEKNEHKKLQKKLVGSWNGTGAAWDYDYGCTATLIVEENGHYTVDIIEGTMTNFVNNSLDDAAHDDKTMIVYYTDSADKGHG